MPKGSHIDTAPLAQWEYDLLLPQLKEPWRCIAEIMWWCGLRVGEVVALQVKDLAPGVLQVRREKGGLSGPIPIPPWLEERIRETGRKRGRLFLVTTGGMWIALRRAAEKAGVRTTIHPHSFRHAFGYRMAKTDLGATPLDHRILVQRMLGHTSAKSTETYFRPDKDAVWAAWEKQWAGKSDKP